MTDTMQVTKIPLHFQFGELRLFAVRSRVAVHDTALGRALTALEDNAPEDSGPPTDWPEGVRGVLVRSQVLRDEPPRISRVEGRIRYVASRYERYFVDLAGTYDEYLAQFSAKSRSTLRRKGRKLEKASGGALDWRSYRTPEEISEFHRIARDVSRKTYQERLLDAGLPASTEFRDRMLADAADGRARGWLLFIADEPVAYLYCPLRADVLVYAHLGYDPAFAKLSPGTVLQLKVLEAAFDDEQCGYFDFTQGGGEHKRYFSTGSVRCADVFYFEPSLRNRLLVRSHSAVDALSSLLGRILDRLGLKPRIKRLLRRGGSQTAPAEAAG